MIDLSDEVKLIALMMVGSIIAINEELEQDKG